VEEVLAAPTTFGDLLRRYRRAAGISQEALADRAGLSRRAISALESGERRLPYRDTVRRLIAALSLSEAERAQLMATAPRQSGTGPVLRPATGGLPARAPRSASPNNLPQPLTGLVGREEDIRAIRRQLVTARLLSLTGPGGVGKTRLALQVAAEEAARSADGVWLIELGALGDPALVPRVVAATLGVREASRRPLLRTLEAALQGRHLLVLDNCEHLLAACAQFAVALLPACPQLRILATSREALAVPGEVVWTVSPLAVPPPAGTTNVASLLTFPAVRLFCDRAREALPTFALTSANAASVAALCRRLDGLPLALELAATRVRALAVEQLSARLDERFRLFAEGSRAAPPRQRTLRSTLDWSYDLLSPPERRIFARLAAFAGGWTLEAAEAVCSSAGQEADGDRQDVLDLLVRLVDQSLVVYEAAAMPLPAGPQPPFPDGRYRMLETVRQYARERLEASGEANDVQQRHAEYYLMLAEDAEPELRGLRQAAWFARLAGEYGNMRAALRWGIEQGATAHTVRLAGALRLFWLFRAPISEGREWLTKVLAMRRPTMPTPEWANVLAVAGILEQARGDFASARPLLQESLELARSVSDELGVAHAAAGLGTLARLQGDFPAARDYLEEAVARLRAQQSKGELASVLSLLGMVVYTQGDPIAASALFEEGLALGRDAGDALAVTTALSGLISGSLDRAEYGRARSWLAESLTLRRDLDDRWSIAWDLEMAAVLSVKECRPRRALQLAGAAAALRVATGTPLPPAEAAHLQERLAPARLARGDADAATAWDEGRAMPLERAIAVALEAPAPCTTPTESAASSSR
jgi:predicted ATPase/DNA-binding XRE family transcriptional regulator